MKLRPWIIWKNILSNQDQSFDSYKLKIYMQALPIAIVGLLAGTYLQWKESPYHLMDVNIGISLSMCVFLFFIFVMIWRKAVIWPLELSFIVAVSMFLILKLAYNAYFNTQEVIAENLIIYMSEFVFWTPSLFISSFIIFNTKFAQRFAVGYFFAILCTGVPAMIRHHESSYFMNFFIQFYIANLVYIFLLFTLQYLRDSYTIAQTKTEMLEEYAYSDGLTGLANRRVFYDFLSYKFESDRYKDRSLAVMLVDLDHFKEVNDNYGHDIGDLLLKEVAVKFKENIRKQDILCRLGGDEFVVLLPETNDRELVTRMADKLLTSLHKPLLINQILIHISLSIGIAFYPEEDIEIKDYLTLIKHADLSLYASKDKGKNCYSYYSSKFDSA